LPISGGAAPIGRGARNFNRKCCDLRSSAAKTFSVSAGDALRDSPRAKKNRDSSDYWPRPRRNSEPSRFSFRISTVAKLPASITDGGQRGGDVFAGVDRVLIYT